MYEYGLRKVLTKKKIVTFLFFYCIKSKEKNRGVKKMTEEKPDKALYLEFLNENQTSFETLVLRHKNNLVYFIQRYVKDFSVAEDIAQDVFVYLLEHKENYKFQYSFKTYLYMIAKSRAINYVTAQKRWRKIENLENYQTDETLEDIIFSREEWSRVRKQLETLKPDMQVAIYLVDMEGLSYQEASKILNKTLSGLKVTLHRARKALAQKVKTGKEEIV